MLALLLDMTLEGVSLQSIHMILLQFRVFRAPRGRTAAPRGAAGTTACARTRANFLARGDAVGDSVGPAENPPVWKK